MKSGYFQGVRIRILQLTDFIKRIQIGRFFYWKGRIFDEEANFFQYLLYDFNPDRFFYKNSIFKYA